MYGQCGDNYHACHLEEGGGAKRCIITGADEAGLNVVEYFNSGLFHQLYVAGLL